MAILMNVEARVVSKRTKQPLEEYQKSDSTVGANESFVEKYIEAKTGEDFQVEVFLKDNFICWGGWGIRFNIKIDGGVVHYGKTYSKAEVSLKEPIVFDSVRFFEGPAFSRIGFRFGSLRMSEVHRLQFFERS